VIAVLPPRSGFRRSFASRLPCMGRLDPLRWSDAHHVRPREASRRLSTSATDAIHEHHCEPTELHRTPPT
jgi:hypothetical protein